MKKFLSGALILLGLTATVQTQAQDYDRYLPYDYEYDFSNNQGWYASALGGVNFLSFQKHRPLFSNESIKLHTKTGYVVGGAIGYKFCSCTPLSYRLEGEIAYRRNDWKKVHSNTLDINLKGFGSVTTYMINGYVDWNLNCNFLVTPYVGAGIGYATTHSNAKFRVNDVSERRASGGNSEGFVWQAIVGLSYPICNKLDMALEYRYLGGFSHAQCNAVCFNLRKFF